MTNNTTTTKEAIREERKHLREYLEVLKYRHSALGLKIAKYEENGEIDKIVDAEEEQNKLKTWMNETSAEINLLGW